MPSTIDWLPSTVVTALALSAILALRVAEHLSVIRTRRRTRDALRGIDTGK